MLKGNNFLSFFAHTHTHTTMLSHIARGLKDITEASMLVIRGVTVSSIFFPFETALQKNVLFYEFIPFDYSRVGERHQQWIYQRHKFPTTFMLTVYMHHHVNERHPRSRCLVPGYLMKCTRNSRFHAAMKRLLTKQLWHTVLLIGK